MTPYRLPFALVLVLLAGPALAHPGHDTTGFLSGFAHPIGGADHLLAMLAVGLYAAHRKDAARWMLPGAFLLAMLAGAGWSTLGFELPAVKASIAASVLVLGLLIAFLVRLPMAAALPLIAVFALFHGHAHHAEMGGVSVLAYTGGFVLATALLLAAGHGIGRWLPDTVPGLWLRRFAGGLIAGAGVVFLGA